MKGACTQAAKMVESAVVPVTEFAWCRCCVGGALAHLKVRRKICK